MARNVVHSGNASDVMPWTNNTGSAVASGHVIKMANTIGVALVDIANGETKPVAIGGVVSGVAKVSAAVFAQGEKLIWDVSAGAFDDSAATPATGDVTGAAIAWLAGSDGQTTCAIKLTPGNTEISASDEL